VNSTPQHGHSAAVAADFPLAGIFLVNAIALRLDPAQARLGNRSKSVKPSEQFANAVPTDES
jgi:hypothetical protein